MKDNFKQNSIVILITTATLVLAGIAIFTAWRLYSLRTTAPEKAKAWACNLYTFSLDSSGTAIVANNSTRSEPAQQAKVYIDSTLITTFNVPALQPSQQATLGTVSIPNTNFAWQIVGTIDCQNSGSITASPTPCEDFVFTIETIPSPTPTPAPGEPAIDLEKHTNGSDADNPKGPELVEGDDVKWEYRVKNIGDLDLQDLVITDDQEGNITSCPKDTLKVGELMICTLHSTARVYQYQNEATVIAYTEDGVKVTDTDPSHYWGEGKPSSPTPVPTPTSTPQITQGDTPTSTAPPIPETGSSLPTIIGISASALLLIGAIILAL